MTSTHKPRENREVKPTLTQGASSVAPLVSKPESSSLKSSGKTKTASPKTFTKKKKKVTKARKSRKAPPNTDQPRIHTKADKARVVRVLEKHHADQAVKAQEQSDKLYESFKAKPMAFAWFYLPHHFRLDSPSFHLGIMEEAAKNRFLSIAAPRGSAKTTVLGLGYALHQLVFKQRRFMVYISNTFKQSTMMLSTLKQELKENERLVRDFKIEITKDAEDVTIFRHLDGFETMVICLGADQMGNIRGRKFGAYRPDLIIGDDIENDELVRSPERRLKLVEDFDNAVVPAGDIDTQFIIIGTILHDDSLLAKLMSKDQYKEYTKVFFQGLYKDPDTKEFFSLWAEKFSVDWLLSYRKDKPHTFAREIQNDPSASGTEEIQKKDFRYWRIDNMNALMFDQEGNIKSKVPLASCKAAIACDLAWEDKQESDYSVILPAYLTPQSDILVDDYICKKGLRPDEFEEIIFTMEERLNAITGSVVPIGFEKAKLEKVARWFLKQAMRVRNRYLVLKDLLWGKEKIERIVTRLQPRYSQHTLYHKHGMGDLELQLVRIRSSAHDDLADALQGVVQLLQFPKSAKKQAIQTEDSAFMQLRSWHIDKTKRRLDKRTNIGQFTMKRNSHYTIPTTVCPI